MNEAIASALKILSYLSQLHPRWIGVWVFIFMMTITQFLSHQKYLYQKAKDRVRLEHAAYTVEQQLRDYLHQSLNVTYTLRFFIENEELPEDFDNLGKLLLELNPELFAVQVVEDGVITHIYPAQGNEGIIGYDILEDPKTRTEAELTKEKGLYFAGPFELRQGGIGIVGRLAIHKNGDFWGFSAVVIKLDSLLKAAGISPSMFPDILFQFSKINQDTGQRENYVSHSDEFVKSKNKVVAEIEEGNWILTARLKYGYSLYELLPFALMGLLLSTMAGIFMAYLAAQPYKLKMLVNSQTHDLLKSKKLLEDTQKTAMIGSWELDLRDNAIQCTETAKKILDIENEEIESVDRLVSLFGPDEKMQSLSQYIDEITTKAGNIDLELPVYQHQSKTFKWVRLTGLSEFENDTCQRIYGTIQDIHQRKSAEQTSQKHLKAIEKQNEALREIAWTQSHVVRAPVARILGLLYMLQNNVIQYDSQILDHLLNSTLELDDIIHQISRKTEQEHIADEQQDTPKVAS